MGQSEKPTVEQLLDVAEHELLERFKKLLNLAKERTKPLVIIVDGIDKFDYFEQTGPSFLTWVPEDLGSDSNIRLVLSSTNGNQALRKLMSCKIRVYELLPFSPEVASNVIQSILSNFHKRLDDSQLQTLLKKKNGHVPQWLYVACFELIVFGSFEKLSEKIESLPDDYEELLSSVMNRIVTEDETNLVKRALTFLFYAKVGLTEQNIRCLLGDMTTKTLLSKSTSFFIYFFVQIFNIPQVNSKAPE